MFVPSKLLLWLVALVLAPAGLLLGMAGASWETMLLASLALLLLAVTDAILSLSRLAAVEVTLPEKVRASKGKTLYLALAVKDTAQRCKQLRIGLAFPPEIDTPTPELDLLLTGPGSSAKVQWELLALERGSYQLSRAYVQTPSYFGFWDMRHSLPCNCELRIYPDLSREKNVLAPLFYRRGSIGTHQVRQLGKGREFEQLRAYVPGDNYSDIYWKGTAKRRYPVTMMHQIERTQELHVLIDISRRSARPLEQDISSAHQLGARFAAKTVAERFIQAAMVLALAAEQQSDRCGLMTFSDQVHTTLPAKGGRGQFNLIRDALYTLQPRTVSPDYQELFVQVGNRIRQRSLIIILTDLAEPWLSESFAEAATSAARRHVILVHSLSSKEYQPLFRPQDSITHPDDLYRKLSGHMIWSELTQTTVQLKQQGIHLTSSTQDQLIADAVSSYLKVKKRQLV
jgi:uncharacterized protein (DUF58 family)